MGHGILKTSVQFHSPPFSINAHHTLSSSNNYQTSTKLEINYTKIRESSSIQMASKGRVSFVVAASISAVEALKDQAGLCRWNYSLRSIQSRVKQNMGTLSQVRKVSSGVGLEEKAKKSEESLRTVMYLSCWGPNS